jgi:DNA-directed RNA polymerase subunit M/transcription elongation factor TFIIS
VEKKMCSSCRILMEKKTESQDGAFYVTVYECPRCGEKEFFAKPVQEALAKERRDEQNRR